ncbi:MAG: glucose-1-phosphate cytidylyltransferase [Clostridiaceae bacterium]|nr:glucose-1-phosphate cytidylyltransferase [Clostridiaceae bacterium]
MKTVILAGGFGTRISEESHLKPKPMVEIGDNPILWHIMKIYSSYGFNDFIICCGYKGFVIKSYFADYYLHMSDITFDFSRENKMEIHSNVAEPWRVTLVDTGLKTMTGGRIKRIQSYIGDEPFFLTYGDGVADVDIPALLEQHRLSRKTVTLTAVQPDGRFGALDIDEDHSVRSFIEKPRGDSAWINGGFMVMNPDVFSYIKGDNTIFEQESLRQLAIDQKLGAYEHKGFWMPMDTMRDKNRLDELWNTGKAPWKRW